MLELLALTNDRMLMLLALKSNIQRQTTSTEYKYNSGINYTKKDFVGLSHGPVFTTLYFIPKLQMGQIRVGRTFVEADLHRS
jgi:hypothetical protein